MVSGHTTIPVALPADAEVSRRMKRVRRRDTSAEVRLRKRLWALGLRYRVDETCSGRYRPDLVFRSSRVAVFVDGCFWHICPEHSTIPVRNREWWLAKLAANARRDAQANEALELAGYAVIRVWEHENMDAAARRIRDVVRKCQGIKRRGVAAPG
jgi:DNA mismatch endonuclease, patch repair protein